MRDIAFRKTGSSVLIAALLLFSPRAGADSWMPAQEMTELSADGRTRVVVTPRSLQGPLAYFEDLSKGREHAGQNPGSEQTRATARVETRRRGQWTLDWEGPLVNDVSPVDVLVASGGTRLVTLDNWHSVGYGDDVVVVYDAAGHQRYQYALSQLLPEDYIDGLPHTVSSIFWRGKARLAQRDEMLEIELVAASSTEDYRSEPEYFRLLIRLSDGAVTLPSGSRWEQSLEAARRVVARRRAEYEEFRIMRSSPLNAPASTDLQDWMRYGWEFSSRDQEAASARHNDFLLPMKSDPDWEEQAESIRENIAAYPEDEVIDSIDVFLSPDAHALADLLVSSFNRLASGSALERRMVFVGHAVDRDRVEAAVKPSGTGFRFVDVDQPIPGRPLPPFEDRGAR